MGGKIQTTKIPYGKFDMLYVCSPMYLVFGLINFDKFITVRLWGNALGFLPGENIFHLPGEYSAPFLNLTGADLLNDRAGLVIRSLTLSEYDGGVLVVVLVLVFCVLRTRFLGEIPGSRAFGEHGFAKFK